MPVDRSRLPPIGPDPPFTFPDIRRGTLPNGLRVWTIEHRAVPLVSLLMLLPVGAAADPEDRPGLAAITSDLLDEGCGSLTAIDVHDVLGRMGAHLETEIGSDATVLTVTALSRFAERAAALLADMVIAPTLDRLDFDRVRELRLNRLIQLRDSAAAIADRTFTERLYAGHPYGHAAIGTEASLAAMTVDDARGFHQRGYAPARVTVIASGDATHAELFDLVAGAFGGWSGAADEAIADPADLPRPAAASGIALVHREGAAQSELRIGHVAAARSSPDYHALLVLNAILGGQFVSRINMNLREHKGYTYSARTSFEFRKGPGPFVLYASVQPDATADAIREAIGELRQIRGERPATRRELEIGRAALTRGYPRSFETAEQISRGTAQLALYGLPDDYFSTFVPRIRQVDESAVTRVAAEHIEPASLLTVIVGDRSRFGAQLDALELGEVAEIVPA
jgi:zinc protease